MTEKGLTYTEQRLLEKCREIELLCKELYSFFAVLYADDEEAALLWRKTADEEQNHADQFTLALKLKKDLPCQVLPDHEKVDSVISQLHTVIEKVRKSPPLLQDALLASIKLEKFIADLHLTCVVVYEDKQSKSMFNAMMASDNDHIASLQDAYDKLTSAQEWSFTG